MEQVRYSICGLGKLGASMAAAIASRGFSVIGVDVVARSVERINAGLAPVEETDLETTIRSNRSRLRATLDVNEAIAGSDVTFVVVPTPSDNRGAFSLEYAKRAFESIGRALAAKDGYHLVVMSGTVLPGSTRHGLIPILEEQSGKHCGVDFGVCYSPEFIALGSIIRDFLNPDFTLVGEFDEQSGAMLERCYAEFMANEAPCRRMSLENAELTKIAVNTFVTTKITFANMLAAICERIPGGNIDVVTNALGSDKRIGSHYLKGALGYGGPCFPRDNVAFGFMARHLGASAGLAETTDRMNRSLATKVAERVRDLVQPNSTVGILGLAYKPFSHVIEESQGIALAREVANLGVKVVAFDPLATEGARLELGNLATITPSIADVLDQSELIIVTTPDPAFRALRAADFGDGKRNVTVVDFWRILQQELDGRNGIRYLPFGYSTDDDANNATLRQLWGSTSSEPVAAGVG